MHHWICKVQFCLALKKGLLPLLRKLALTSSICEFTLPAIPQDKAHCIMYAPEYDNISPLSPTRCNFLVMAVVGSGGCMRCGLL
jgi:hypothetical protein